MSIVTHPADGGTGTRPAARRLSLALAASALLLAGALGDAQAAGTGRGDMEVEEGSGRRIEIYDVPSIRPARTRPRPALRTQRVASRPWWDIYDDPAGLRRDLRAAWFLGVPVAGPSGYGAYGRLAGGSGGRVRGAYASGDMRTIRQYPRPTDTRRPWALRGN